MTRAAIGVDIGGTSVKLGLVSARGRVLARATFLTGRSAGRERTLEALTGRGRELQVRARRLGLRVAGLGIGAPGAIDVERGRVYFFPNLPGWKDTPLRALLERRLSLRVRLDNDANAMAFGEYVFGAGQGARNVIALTLGTGVGGGIIFDGRLFHGPAYSAAEIGHLVINEDGPRCACGNNGCIETYVGNGYFVRMVRAELRAGARSVLRRWVETDGEELTPLLVSQAARRGDLFARQVWRRTGEHLGTALVGLVNILNPERIILGGGIAQNRAFLFPAIRRTIRKKAFPIAARSVRVIPAALGVDAGLVGAAALVLAG